MPRTSPRTSSNPTAFASLAVFSRDRTDMRRARSRPIRAAKIMMPSPPSWMSSMMTTCPNGLQNVGVSTTVSPVTQTAEVAVNSASTNDGDSPAAVEIGSISSAVPTSTAEPKPTTTACSGCSRAAARRDIRRPGRNLAPVLTTQHYSARRRTGRADVPTYARGASGRRSVAAHRLETP